MPISPRGFVGERHVGRTRVNAAVHGRIIAAHRGNHSVDHRQRFLRGGGGIEIMPASSQTGKVSA